MKKIQKGKPGYLNYKRKVEILRTVIYFVIVLAIFALGYWQTHTRLNLLTVVAILGCLPASKALVGVIHVIHINQLNCHRRRKSQENQNI